MFDYNYNNIGTLTVCLPGSLPPVGGLLTPNNPNSMQKNLTRSTIRNSASNWTL